MEVIDWNRDLLRQYLGTYFPRTYAEAYDIFSIFFSRRATMYAGQEKISVLDFGCGTGGAVLGMIDAIERFLPKVKRVRVTALDGNSNALKFFEQIVIRRNALYGKTGVVCEFAPFAVKIDDFYDMGIVAEVIRNRRYDFVITFKAICEFVSKKQFEKKNPYAHFIQTFRSKVKPGGAICIADITSRDGDSGEWLPMMLDRGVAESGAELLDRNDGFNKTYFTSHSGAASDKSKIAWRTIRG